MRSKFSFKPYYKITLLTRFSLIIFYKQSWSCRRPPRPPKKSIPGSHCSLHGSQPPLLPLPVHLSSPCLVQSTPTLGSPTLLLPATTCPPLGLAGCYSFGPQASGGWHFLQEALLTTSPPRLQPAVFMPTAPGLLQHGPHVQLRHCFSLVLSSVCGAPEGRTLPRPCHLPAPAIAAPSSPTRIEITESGPPRPPPSVR